MTQRTGPASGTHSPGFPFLCLNRKRITAVTMLSKYVCIFKIDLHRNSEKLVKIIIHPEGLPCHFQAMSKI